MDFDYITKNDLLSYFSITAFTNILMQGLIYTGFIQVVFAILIYGIINTLIATKFISDLFGILIVICVLLLSFLNLSIFGYAVGVL